MGSKADICLKENKKENHKIKHFQTTALLTDNSDTGTSLNDANFCKLDGYFVKKRVNIATPESVGVATGISQVFLIS